MLSPKDRVGGPRLSLPLALGGCHSLTLPVEPTHAGSEPASRMVGRLPYVLLVTVVPRFLPRSGLSLRVSLANLSQVRASYAVQRAVCFRNPREAMRSERCASVSPDQRDAHTQHTHMCIHHRNVTRCEHALERGWISFWLIRAFDCAMCTHHQVL